MEHAQEEDDKETPAHGEETYSHLVEKDKDVEREYNRDSFVQQYCKEVKIILHVVNQSERLAVFSKMEPISRKLEGGTESLKYLSFTVNDKGFDRSREYTLGLFAGYKTALVQTAPGQKCCPEIESAIVQFPNAAWIIGVGVAYGSDQEKQKLGDVLVSETIEMIDAEKFHKSGATTSRGARVDIAARLSTHFCKGYDKFFNLFACTKDNLRYSKVHVGTVASGFLVDNKSLKEKLLANAPEAIGGEMEGKVLMNVTKEQNPRQVEAIIIKGVCDYGDDTKSKKWQLTAALAAVEYAHLRLEETKGFLFGIPLVLAPPVGLKVDGVSTTSVAISWQPLDDPITNYQVSYTADGGNEQFLDVGDMTHTELTSLEPQTVYTIRVRAKTEEYGDWSTPITTYTLKKAPPPVGLKVDGVTSTSVAISWLPLDGPIRNYQVMYTADVGNEQFLDVGDMTRTELTSLEPETEYTICVRAKTREYGEWSTPIKTCTLKIVPSPPIGLKVDGIGITSVAISWLPLDDLLKNYQVSYQVSYTADGANEKLLEVGEMAHTKLTSLEPETEYTICVRAKTREYGDWSTPIKTKTENVAEKVSKLLDSFKEITFSQLRILKLIFYGTPRAGKTTLKEQLLKHVKGVPLLPRGSTQQSTNIAQICEHIFVERVILTGEKGNIWQWNVQKLDDIAKVLLRCMDNEHLQCELGKSHLEISINEGTATNVASSSVSKDNGIQQKAQVEQQRDVEIPQFDVIKPQELKAVLKKDMPQMEQTQMIEQKKQLENIEQIKKMFLNAVNTGGWDKVMSALNIDKAAFLQIIDCGGQPSFQEIFPLLISGPSLTIIIFKLSDGLEAKYSVQYQPQGGNKRPKTWNDSYVVKDIIFHALSTFISHRAHNDTNISSDFVSHSTHEGKQKPFLFLVGTHKDKISEDPPGNNIDPKNKILEIAEQIRGWLKGKAFECVLATEIENLITGIDNFNEQDIKLIKEKIDKEISELHSHNIPAPLLVFDFVLHTYAKENNLCKVSIDDCKKLAECCGLKNDINDVLIYLHNNAGALLYYSDIEGLNKYVIIDFQLIINSISKIIIEYFENAQSHLQDKEEFHHKGQFDESVLKEVEGCLEKDELLILLQRRHIISKIEGTSMYFMPSVLPKADKLHCNNSRSFLVIFPDRFCPVGLFCATTTSLIGSTNISNCKWELRITEHKKDKIHFKFICLDNSYHVIFSAFPTHFEVCLIEPTKNLTKVVPKVKQMIYRNINDIILKFCKELYYPFPSFGFYCPCKCRGDNSENQQPAMCPFTEKCEQMTCIYCETESSLTEEHKEWMIQLSVEVSQEKQKEEDNELTQDQEFKNAWQKLTHVMMDMLNGRDVYVNNLLCSKGLLSDSEKETVQSKTVTSEANEMLMAAIRRKGQKGLDGLVECLKKEVGYTALVEEIEKEGDNGLTQDQEFKDAWPRLTTVMMDKLDGHDASMNASLHSIGLLSRYEYETVQSKTVTSEANAMLMAAIRRKGRKGLDGLVECLKKEVGYTALVEEIEKVWPFPTAPPTDEADCIEIIQQPQQHVRARVNETITLKCKAHNNSGKELVYEWFRDNNSETDLHQVQAAPTATVPTATVPTATVPTLRPLVITNQPQSLKVPYGSEARLSCTEEGLHGQVITYEWFKVGGAKIYSGTSGDHVITGVTCEDEGEYLCVASCGDCKVDSSRVNLLVVMPLDSEPSMKQLMNKVAAVIPNKYWTVGLQLGLTQAELNTIRPQHQSLEDNQRAFGEIFNTWRSRGSPPYTWRSIIRVLGSASVGEVALSKQLTP